MMRVLIVIVLALGLLFPAHAADEKNLLYLVTFGRADDVQLMLEQGADPDVLDAQGWPALSTAAARRDGEGPKIVEALLDAGADIDAGGPGGLHPLGVAIEKNRTETALFLLDRGADRTTLYRGKASPLQLAQQQGNQAIIEHIGALEAAALRQDRYLHSPEHKHELIVEYAAAKCLGEYWHQILRLGPDEETRRIAAQRRANAGGQSAKPLEELHTLFGWPSQKLESVSKNVRKRVAYEISAHENARQREAAGIGGEDDAVARCTRISRTWKQGLRPDQARRLME